MNHTYVFASLQPTEFCLGFQLRASFGDLSSFNVTVGLQT
jgi:hypothetical protein